jgi:hypothetical protein
MDLKLHTGDATVKFIEKRNITVHAEETREAVNVYNSLAKNNVLIGCLFHSAY